MDVDVDMLYVSEGSKVTVELDQFYEQKIVVPRSPHRTINFSIHMQVCKQTICLIVLKRIIAPMVSRTESAPFAVNLDVKQVKRQEHLQQFCVVYHCVVLL